MMRKDIDALRGAFSHVDTWVFDLDNTLYPPRCGILGAAEERMSAFVGQELGLTLDDALALRKQLRLKYGTTLRGLMSDYDIDPERFLDFVHDVDHGPLGTAPDLSVALAALPGRKLVYTNASRNHAEGVMRSLGIDGLFEDIVCITRSRYVPKREGSAFENFIQLAAVDPRRAAMFEDLECNLVPAHALGFTTVLVTPESDGLGTAPSSAGHVHHITSDLNAFLRALALD